MFCKKEKLLIKTLLSLKVLYTQKTEIKKITSFFCNYITNSIVCQMFPLLSGPKRRQQLKGKSAIV